MNSYWAVIGDVVRSRAIGDRAAFQERLRAVLAAANRASGSALAARWTITLGDEFQALYRTAEPLPTALERICHRLPGQPLRFGVGFGPLATPLRRDAVGMDGQCFYNARSAVERARRTRYAVVVEAGGARAERATDFWNLAMAVIRGRTARQAEVIDTYVAAGTQSRVAQALGITQGTASRELARGHFEEVEAALRHLAAMLGELSADRGAGA